MISKVISFEEGLYQLVLLRVYPHYFNLLQGTVPFYTANEICRLHEVNLMAYFKITNSLI